MPCTLPNFKMIIQNEEYIDEIDCKMDSLSDFYILMSKSKPLDFLSDTFSDTSKLDTCKLDAPKTQFIDAACNLICWHK